MKVWGLFLSGFVLGWGSQVQASMKDLYEGIRYGDLKQVEKAIEADEVKNNINQPFDDILVEEDQLKGLTPLMYAIYEFATAEERGAFFRLFIRSSIDTRKEIIDLLLSNQFLDPNAQGGSKYTPLTYVIF